ncbi:seipin isoform X2 [Galleria mellonella]|uniref:Seipin n=1 Tax=Galleria mellonella TaxID=7137 RepID=A0ABM3M8P7_GALME|nr:seipin isoform X2 [Galleria mellonella]
MSLGSLINYMNPFRIFQQYVSLPVEVFISRQYTGYKKKTEEGLSSVKELLFRAGVIAVFFAAIVWLSIFMYVVFYYTYMPNVTHVRPVHLQFKSCDEVMGVCSFPSAHVQLTRRSQMLMSGQSYRIKLVLDMPESQTNKDLGMFMVCAQMRAKGGVLVSSSCRAAMLRHRSILHYIMRTFTWAPVFLTGLDEEKQQLHVELFSDFEDDENVPITDAYVELQSRYAQVYSCELHVEAHFAGLRYYMYHWPKISALIGISSNLFFVSLVFILSWYHLQDGLPEFIKSKLVTEIKTEKEDDVPRGGKIKLEKEDSPPFFEGDILLEELQKIEEPKKKKT